MIRHIVGRVTQPIYVFPSGFLDLAQPPPPWDSQAKAVAILGDYRIPQKRRSDIDRIRNIFLRHPWQFRKELLAIGDRFGGSNVPPSRGQVVNGLRNATHDKKHPSLQSSSPPPNPLLAATVTLPQTMIFARLIPQPC